MPRNCYTFVNEECGSCGHVRPLRVHGRTGKRSACKQCIHEKIVKIKAKKRAAALALILAMPERKCEKCNRKRLASEFRKVSRKTTLGNPRMPSKICKECGNRKARKYRASEKYQEYLDASRAKRLKRDRRRRPRPERSVFHEKAHSFIYNCIKTGKIARPNRCACGRRSPGVKIKAYVENAESGRSLSVEDIKFACGPCLTRINIAKARTPQENAKRHVLFGTDSMLALRPPPDMKRLHAERAAEHKEAEARDAALRAMDPKRAFLSLVGSVGDRRAIRENLAECVLGVWLTKN